jgi:hypothetical protein
MGGLLRQFDQLLEIDRLRNRVQDLLSYNNHQVAERRRIAGAARNLRAAQQTYPMDPKVVEIAARQLDEVLGIGIPKKKLLILGYARHGKDTVAEILRDEHGYNFTSSSYFCAEKVCRPYLAERGVHYASLDECYKDRVNHRADWYDAIAAFNAQDPTALSKGILEIGDIYVGMRNAREYAVAKDLFDEVWWVNSTGRGLPPEDKSSMDIVFDPNEMRLIENNGSVDELKALIATLI